MARWLRRLSMILLVVTSCGGEVRKSESVDGGASQTSPSGGGGSFFPGNKISLPDCKPGFDPNEQPTTNCNFMVAGLCYDTKIDACACACPRDRSNTNCTSGVPVDNGRVVVICD